MRSRALAVVALFVACAVLVATAAGTSDSDSCPIVYPKQFVAYHLGADERITIDGRLDDPAWLAVGASDAFIDIQGSPPQPVPRFHTHFKFRWDDTFLYVGGYVSEPNVWANMTKHDSVVFNDNDFEMFVDPDSSTHHYKEFEINAINTTWDLMLNKPYIDGGSANNSWDMEGFMRTATFVAGPINDPNAGLDQYWTVEMALPHSFYVQSCFRARSPPHDKDLWRINFSRVEYHVRVVNGVYEKVPGAPVDNWVWQSQDAVNMHLPERWGYVQFSTDPVNTTKIAADPEYPQRAALAQVYDAEHEFSAENGYFTTDIAQLQQYDLPDWVLDGSCGTQPPNITLPTTYSFTAFIESETPGLTVGHIQSDRLIWFGDTPPPDAIL